MVELRKLKGGKEAKIYPTGVHKKTICPKAKITFIGQGGLKSILSKMTNIGNIFLSSQEQQEQEWRI